MKKSEIQTLPDELKSFVHYQQAIRGKSELTVLEYASDLRTFFRYLLRESGAVPKDTDLKDISIENVDLDFIKKITISDIYAFLAFCQSDLGNSAKTRARKSSSIRMFFKFLTTNQKKLSENPALDLDSPRFKKSLPKYLTLEESLNLLDSIDGKFYERDYCIITLFLNCGLRLSELVGLNLQSIRSDNSLRVLGKGNKERIVYLNSACIDSLNKYLAVRPTDGIKDREALFISRQKNRISTKTVQHIVKKFLEKSGLNEEGFSVHKLRHTAATLLYQHGNVDVMLLKELLGHESLATTQIYTHVVNEQLKKAIDSNPLADVRKKPSQSN